ncbi:MAG TPA: hypothetical protein VF783_19525 [Terriglobales bacterium]
MGPYQGAAAWRRWMVAAATLALAAPLWAQAPKIFRDGDSWVEETTGTLSAGHEFRSFMDIGSLLVEGNSSQISYVVRKRARVGSEEEARRQFEQLRISATKVGDAVVLEGRLLSRSVNRLSADIVVQIPRMTQLVKVETKGGNLALSSVSGSIIGATTGGNVKVDTVSGPVKIMSGGGNMEASNVASDLYFQSGGGNVSIDRANGQVTVKTGGGQVAIGTAGPTVVETGAGNVDVKRCNGDLHATTGGGNLNLGDVYGAVTADTGGGTVKLASAKGDVRVVTGGGAVELMKLGESAHVETGGGSITAQFVAGRSQFKDSSLRTAVGNIVVFLPRDLGVSVHASTEMANGTGITSTFSGLTISSEGGKYGPKSMSAEGSLNGGGPILRVRTTIGQIDIRQSP